MTINPGWLALLVSIAPLATASAQNPLEEFRSRPRAQVLVLGVMHFKDAGLDGYKPQFGWDMLSPARQREIEEVTALLAAWRPTRIAVERRTDRQPMVDSLYREYLAGRMAPDPNEIYQLGFRLAKQLGHGKVYAVDGPSRSFDSTMTRDDYQRRLVQLQAGSPADPGWDARFTALYRMDDSLKTVRTLRETLLYQNSAERLAIGHGHYLVGPMLLGPPGDYFGADIQTAWYNRNLRITSNVMRLAGSPEDRILLVIGAGHVPIIRHALASAPGIRLIDVSEVLR